jgi:hypothetical protein
MNGYAGEDAPSNLMTGNKLVKSLSSKLQYYLDKTTPHVHARWAGLAAFIVLYGIRVFFLQVLSLIKFAWGGNVCPFLNISA